MKSPENAAAWNDGRGVQGRLGLESHALLVHVRTANCDRACCCQRIASPTQSRWRRYLVDPAILGCLLASIAGTSANAQQPDSAAGSQWFTGSLIAPSPALSTAGAVLIEPYAVYTGDSGAYSANWNHHSVSNRMSAAQSETLIEYGITDRLSIQAFPTFGTLWTGQNAADGVGDLPVELKYRVNDQNAATGAPSVTMLLGVNFPTGKYDGLSVSSVGQGSGTFIAHEGILLQSLFDTWGDHPMRIRLYADAYEPLAAASVHDISVYGTAQGFNGRVTPGFAADAGLGAEYALNRRWALALDIVQNYDNTTIVSGSTGSAAARTSNQPVGIALSLAPEVEYNFSADVGVIAGIQFSVAGRNAASYVAPQIALSVSF